MKKKPRGSHKSVLRHRKADMTMDYRTPAKQLHDMKDTSHKELLRVGGSHSEMKHKPKIKSLYIPQAESPGIS